MSKKKAITKLIINLVLIVIFIFLAFTSFSIGVYDYKAPISSIPLGIELSGGVYVVFDVDIPLDANGKPLYTDEELTSNIEATITILKNRLTAAGYSEATVVETGANRIRVEVADIDSENAVDVDEIFDIIGTPAVLEFRDEAGNVLLSGQLGDIKSANAGFNSQENEYGVYLQFSKEGTQKFSEATKNNIGKSIYIFLDDECISYPRVSSQITDGNAVISGSFDYDSSKALAAQIQGGALTVDLTVVEQSNSSATLGKNALNTSLFAALLGLLLIFIYMVVVYGGLGIIADMALCVYTVIVVFILGLFNFVQLSLAGIAGIVLSIGMAVDANVIIFERIKDEYSTGKNIQSSCQAGFKRALAAIVDSNITTIIACGVLFFLGSATIKSFASTLFIGIIVSMFSSLVVSRRYINLMNCINSTDAKFYKLGLED